MQSIMHEDEEDVEEKENIDENERKKLRVQKFKQRENR
jgi:hypothetical protein